MSFECAKDDLSELVALFFPLPCFVYLKQIKRTTGKEEEEEKKWKVLSSAVFDKLPYFKQAWFRLEYM